MSFFGLPDKSERIGVPELNFEKIIPQCFRHTFAAGCSEADISLKTVSVFVLTGHTQLRFTINLYRYVIQESLFESIKRYYNKWQAGEKKPGAKLAQRHGKENAGCLENS